MDPSIGGSPSCSIGTLTDENNAAAADKYQVDSFALVLLQAGKSWLVGKDYVVKDVDLPLFRFAN